MSIFLTIMALLAGFVLEAVVLYFLLNMLKDAGAVGKNYAEQEIPVSAGISFPLVVLMVYLLYGLFYPQDTAASVFFLGITMISLLGFIDDSLGARDVTGLKGHFKALLKGRLTTGGLKAVGGGIVALYLAVSSHAVLTGEIILDALIIALFTNMLNLLDLRPGRAIKGFLIFFLIIVIAALGQVSWLFMAPLVGAVIYYFRIDIKARAMMGDAGSNVLGLSLGYLCIINLGLVPRIMVLVLLIAMHIYTEKYSLSRTIDQVRILKIMDELGRG